MIPHLCSLKPPEGGLVETEHCKPGHGQGDRLVRPSRNVNWDTRLLVANPGSPVSGVCPQELVPSAQCLRQTGRQHVARKTAHHRQSLQPWAGRINQYMMHPARRRTIIGHKQTALAYLRNDTPPRGNEHTDCCNVDVLVHTRGLH